MAYSGSNHPGLAGVATLTAVAPLKTRPATDWIGYLDLSEATFQDDAPETIRAVGFAVKVDLKLAWGV